MPIPVIGSHGTTGCADTDRSDKRFGRMLYKYGSYGSEFNGVYGGSSGRLGLYG